MQKIKEKLDWVLARVCIFCFAFLVVLVSYQVFTRYCVGKPSEFSEALATDVFVWLALFGAALVFGERGHMNVAFVRDKMPKSVGLVVDILVETIILCFSSIVMFYGGIKIAATTWHSMNESLPVSDGQIYLILPISGALIVFYAIYNIHFLIKNKNNENQDLQESNIEKI